MNPAREFLRRKAMTEVIRMARSNATSRPQYTHWHGFAVNVDALSVAGVLPSPIGDAERCAAESAVRAAEMEESSAEREVVCYVPSNGQTTYYFGSREDLLGAICQSGIEDVYVRDSLHLQTFLCVHRLLRDVLNHPLYSGIQMVAHKLKSARNGEVFYLVEQPDVWLKFLLEYPGSKHTLRHHKMTKRVE